MSSLGSVIGDKVEMPARGIQTAHIIGAIERNDRPFDILVMKLSLVGGQCLIKRFVGLFLFQFTSHKHLLALNGTKGFGPKKIHAIASYLLEEGNGQLNDVEMCELIADLIGRKAIKGVKQFEPSEFKSALIRAERILDQSAAIGISMISRYESLYPKALLDTVSEDGRLATNFSYERLNVLMPGYGYPYCHDGGCLEQKAPAETGLFLIDMSTGKRRMLLSLEQLAKESDSPLAALESHFVTHSEFSKDGRYVSFMHRHIAVLFRIRQLIKAPQL